MHDFKVQNFQFYKAVPFVGEISGDAFVFIKNNCILLSLTIGTKILRATLPYSEQILYKVEVQALTTERELSECLGASARPRADVWWDYTGTVD